MADEKELTELSPWDRAKRVAGNVMQHIRDEANRPYTGYTGTAGLSMGETKAAGELMDPTVDAREFIKSPGLGTGAMAAMGITPPTKLAGRGAKAAVNYIKDELSSFPWLRKIDEAQKLEEAREGLERYRDFLGPHVEVVDMDPQMFSADENVINFINDLKRSTGPSLNIDSVTQGRGRDFYTEDGRVLGKVAFGDGIDGSDLHIDALMTSIDQRGKGVGSKMLKELTDMADEHNVTLSLEALPFGGGPQVEQEDLIKWYERNGFELTPSLDSDEFMVRLPNYPNR